MRSSGRFRAGAAALLIACTACGASAPHALATFHLMQVREVYPGSAANPDSEYVELQMYASGQQFVGGHVVRTYGATGGLTGRKLFSKDADRGASQSTILMATPQAEAQFGVAADGALSPGHLEPAGGAVCWEAIDCVSWGSFTGSPAVARGIAGDARRRPGRHGSAPHHRARLPHAARGDRRSRQQRPRLPGGLPRPEAQFHSPRRARVHIPAGRQWRRALAGSTAVVVPQTSITRAPGHRTHDRTPTFRFIADIPGATFLCRLDRGSFRRCRSPFTSKSLRRGRHVFAVKARAPGGATDPSPALYRFRVRATPDGPR